jgi:hypothetical protein
MDPYGMPYKQDSGLRCDTPEQLAGIKTMRAAIMRFACKAFQDICVVEFRKSVDFGAGGIPVDEVVHQGVNYSYCFSPDHGQPFRHISPRGL